MRGERGGISAVTVQAAWQYWRNVPGFAAVNEIGRRPPSRFILSHAVWSRSMRGNSCGISNGASLMLQASAAVVAVQLTCRRIIGLVTSSTLIRLWTMPRKAHRNFQYHAAPTR